MRNGLPARLLAATCRRNRPVVCSNSCTGIPREPVSLTENEKVVGGQWPVAGGQFKFSVRIQAALGMSSRPVKTDTFIPTRSSLLKRLKNWGDQESWQEFFNLYGKLILSVAVKAGLTTAEAQDVLQETLVVVARKMPSFAYDPALGSFKSWLLLITRRRIEKQLRKRMPLYAGRAHPPDGTSRTATIEKICDPAGFDLEAIWDREWKTNLAAAALARLKRQVKPRQFQMFDLYVIQQWPVKEVARALGVSIAQVYVNKHRVAGLLKKELKDLEKKMFRTMPIA
jgi:RNA polymerase sigma-70 factor (ECF subfamily)